MKIVSAIFSVIFVISGIYLANELIKVIEDINSKYPSMGLVGWLCLILWGVSCAFVWHYFEKRFNRIGPTAPKTATNPWGQSVTNPRGYEASLVYMIFTLPLVMLAIDAVFG